MAGLSSIVDRATAGVDDVRRRAPLVDHIIRTQARYDKAQGGLNAGGIGYYGFLSFFPLLALALFVVGRIADVFPESEDNLTSAISSAFPGIIGTAEHQVSLADVQSAAATLGWLGLAGAVLTGLGWMSAMRTALVDIFELTPDERPNLLVGRLRDVMTLPVLGVTLAVSVAVSAVVTRFSPQLLDWLALSEGLDPLLRVASVVVAVAASTVLFWSMYLLLAHPPTPRRALWQGALLAAVGFEVLKLLATWLLGHTAGQPAFQIFGIALIVVVWINYFARITLYGAAWADTTRRSRTRRAERDAARATVDPRPAHASEPPPASVAVPVATGARPGGGARPGLGLVGFAAGVGSALTVLALLRRRSRR
ncbi:MAG: YhjD/YihY/BrkB family envelope integrity protein [Nocardioidaceae bacterium]